MSPSLEQITIEVAELTDDVDLVAMLHVENAERAAFRHCWTLLDAEASLVVGAGGTVGVLAWCGPDAVDGMEVSSGGSNTAAVEYRLGGLYPQPFPPGCEILIETVYAAVREFLATRRKPAGVRWRSEREAWGQPGG